MYLTLKQKKKVSSLFLILMLMFNGCAYLLCLNAMQKIGELEDTKAFILDVTWPEMYPEMAPKISLDAFFNNRM